MFKKQSQPERTAQLNRASKNYITPGDRIVDPGPRRFFGLMKPKFISVLDSKSRVIPLAPF